MVTFLVCLVVVGGAVVLILRVTLADVVKPATGEAQTHDGAAPRTLVGTARKATTFLIPTAEAGHARRPLAAAIDTSSERRPAAAFLIPTGAVSARIGAEPTAPPEAGAPSAPDVEPVVGPSLDERVAAARTREAVRVAEARRIATADAERLAEAERTAAADRVGAAGRSAATAEAERLATAQRAAAEQLVAEHRQREAEAGRVPADEQVDEATRVALAEAARMARLDLATSATIPFVPVRSSGRTGVIDPIDRPIVWRPDPTTGGVEEATAVTPVRGQGTTERPATVTDTRPPSRPVTRVPRPPRPTFARRLLARIAGAVKLAVLLLLVGTGLALLLGLAVVLLALGVRAAIGG